MGKTVCVTGGAGFIGSHVADAMVRDGHRVVIIDDLSSGVRENVPSEAELVVEDIRSQHAADLLAEHQVDVIFHLAAQMSVRQSVADPRFDADVNIGGLINLLEGARHAGVRQVVFASTGGAMYGEQDVHPADESHPLRPVSPYGVAKLASERYLYFYNQEYGLDATCLRFANVYGPRQNPHGEAGVVAIFLNSLLSGHRPTINGDGLQTRDYVYVGDVVRCNVAAMGRPGFHIYNVGTGIETDVVKLYREICSALGLEVEAVHGPAASGEQRRSSISADLLTKELGISIITPLEEGLSATAGWFRGRTTGMS